MVDQGGGLAVYLHPEEAVVEVLCGAAWATLRAALEQAGVATRQPGPYRLRLLAPVVVLNAPRPPALVLRVWGPVELAPALPTLSRAPAILVAQADELELAYRFAKHYASQQRIASAGVLWLGDAPAAFTPMCRHFLSASPPRASTPRVVPGAAKGAGLPLWRDIHALVVTMRQENEKTMSAHLYTPHVQTC
jgi:hypothetical protein